MSKRTSREYRESGKLSHRRKREKGDRVKGKIDRLFPPAEPRNPMQHTLIVVCNDEHVQAVHVDASDSNIDGTLRIYEDGMLAADYPPGEWTHIKLVEVDTTPETEG